VTDHDYGDNGSSPARHLPEQPLARAFWQTILDSDDFVPKPVEIHPSRRRCKSG
jgi:hypothetical protein